ncbi:MAG: NYN domain-containing protein [Bryobacteraceae bacterium]
MLLGTHYLFIDGDYFRRACSDVFAPLFQIEPEIDFGAMRDYVGCQKAFYYGCVDDAPRTNEDEARRAARVEEEERKYEKIQAVSGFHVRLGTLVGTKPKRLRQKEVDVQLAVDMLSHAAAKNMQSATLVAGDLDFRPVVRALVQFGTYVRLCYASNSVAKDLLWASDEGWELTVEDVHHWTTSEFRSQHPLPTVQRLGAPPGVAFATQRPVIRERGQLGQSEVEAWFTERDQEHRIVVNDGDGMWSCFSHRDRHLLERFILRKRGEILWKD